MSILNEQPIQNNRVLHLSFDEKRRPYLVFEQIFEDHRLSEIKGCLHQALETCLTTDQYPFCEADSRADLVIYFSEVFKCIEAASLIARMLKLFDISVEEESPD